MPKTRKRTPEQEALAAFVSTGEAHSEAARRVEAAGPSLFRDARKRLGLRQDQLADRLGVNRTYVSKIENGRMPPGRPILESLHRLLNEVGQ